MKSRPLNFRLNRYSPLAEGLVFAGLGGRNCVGSALFADSSLYGNHGTLTNMVPATDWVWSSELGRWGVEFEAGLQSIILDRLVPLGTSYTLSCWIYGKVLTGDRREILSNNDESSNWEINTSAYMRHNVNGTDFDETTTAGPLAVNTLYHIGLIRHTSPMSWYINGVEVDTDAYSSTAPFSFDRIGNDSANGDDFVGIIYDMLALTGNHPEVMAAHSDPSNTMLEIGHVPLILPPTRKLWPAAVIGGEESNLILPHHGMMAM